MKNPALKSAISGVANKLTRRVRVKCNDWSVFWEHVSFWLERGYTVDVPENLVTNIL